MSLPVQDALALNNSLSRQYKTEADPVRRREILKILYDLDKPFFQSWKVHIAEDREDYESEIYIWMHRALENYEPDKLPFLYYLRWYVGKCRRDFYSKVHKQKLAREALADTEPSVEQSEKDTLFWRRIKTLVTPQQWALLEAHMLEGLDLKDAAARVGLTYHAARHRLAEAYDLIKVEMAKEPTNKTPSLTNATPTKTNPAWLSPKALSDRLALTGRYIRMLLDPNTAPRYCPYQIDTRDVLPLQGGRIRYLETHTEGLVFPRLLRRKKETPVTLRQESR